MDIIDFRYRPPYGSYWETIMYRDLERAKRCSEAFGMNQSPAVAARDMEASLTEMDRAGIGMAVLAGRKVLPHIGVVDNQDIVDLIHAYPGRFTGMAGVDPSDGPEAMEELERYVVGEGLRGIVMEPGLTKTPCSWRMNGFSRSMGAARRWVSPSCSWWAPTAARTSSTPSRSTPSGWPRRFPN